MRATRMVVSSVVALTLCGAAAAAQDKPPSQTDAGVDGRVIGAGSGSAMGAPGNNAVDTSQGGVAGTGMGKMPAGANAAGKGQTVKGPAGQGIPPMQAPSK